MNEPCASAADVTFDAPLALEAIEVRGVRMRLLSPFETSFGRITSRLALLVRVEAGGMSGWGEVVAFESPMFTAETAMTARHVIRDFLAPSLLQRRVRSLSELASAFSRVRGHQMAKAGLELACMDLAGRAASRPVAALLGGTRTRVPVGVSLGIQPSTERLIEIMERHIADGYQRIKLKIKPGVDRDVVAAVRGRFPDLQLSVDANSAYTLDDLDALQSLDDFNLLMIEQPLAPDDLLDHAELQSVLRTAICLDESIGSARHAYHALRLGSCRIVNIKVGRVGGYSEALQIHALCRANQVPVWCGGMLESGIGRAHNLALASLPGFTLPADISASARYYARDIVSPVATVAADGTAFVPVAPGIGVDVDVEYIEACSESMDRIEASAAVALP
jgi:O-succinylbenzoate synthase